MEQKAKYNNVLTITVYSFSYRKGYPVENAGNGGGFIFDCRCMHNPGRYEQYKQLTGLDSEVKEFLEKQGEVQPFLKNVEALADMAVKKYLKRGFTDLLIGFGCTGGQHRSVYCAEHISLYLKETYPQVRVLLCHREQNICKAL